jgi:hypothetical protein
MQSTREIRLQAECGHTVIRQFLPRSINPYDLGLAAQDALGADFSGHTRHLAGEDLKLVHHRIDNLELALVCRLPSAGYGETYPLESRNLRVHFHRVDLDLLAQVTASDGCDDLSDFP